MEETSNDSLVARRSRRSTAGNRMAAALAEITLETTSNEMDDDVDFVNNMDEEDIFESDFESTDEEAAQDDMGAGDQVVQEEEKRARKIARSRLEKAVTAAHAKHKVTFDSEAEAPTTILKSRDTRRRVSLGVVINAETGEVMSKEKGSPRRKRHSQRRHTILNTSATVKRMKRDEEKKAATPKKIRSESKVFTQAELIASALDNEEGNIVEHRDYLKNEEDKRKRARVVRAKVEGPLLRWVSKGEETKTLLPPPIPPRPAHYSTYLNSVSGAVYRHHTFSHSQSISQTPTTTFAAPLNHTPIFIGNGPVTVSMPPSQQSSQAQPPTKQSQFEPTNYISYSPQVNASIPAPPAPNIPEPVERTEKVARNYIIHEVAQYDGAPKVSWNETMAAMFGNHVDWDELRVYIGRNRPLSRPKQICPITGKQAKYRDPRTGVPYADLKAYKVLTSILNHEFIWNASLGCYIDRGAPTETDNDAMAS